MSRLHNFVLDATLIRQQLHQIRLSDGLKSLLTVYRSSRFINQWTLGFQGTFSVICSTRSFWRTNSIFKAQ